MQQIINELCNLGLALSPSATEFEGFAPDSGHAVVMEYPVQTGRYKGRTFKVALSFQEKGYPEYPPHFIHVADLPGQKLTPHSEHSSKGRQWKVFSVPPKDFWDGLPAEEKNMRTYMRRHMLRFWSEL